jgi:hypothetical protein
VNRWQTASDLKREIEWIEKSVTAPGAVTTSADSIKRRKKGVVAGLLVLDALIVIAGLGWWWMDRTQQQLGGTIKLIH